ncbi:MAG: hypothetical protein ABI045_01255 [Flavobacteriales bacterium]
MKHHQYPSTNKKPDNGISGTILSQYTQCQRLRHNRYVMLDAQNQLKAPHICDENL